MARVGRQPRRGDDGFGLVEVMFSLSILLIVLVASAYLVDNVVQQAAVNRQKVAATELAEQYLETTANAPLSTLQANIAKDVLLTATPVTVGGIQYSVWSHLEWAATGAQQSLCTSGNPPQVIRATMTVKWGAGLGANTLGETSIINPPYGALVPGDGFLSIQIAGRSAPAAPTDTTNLINVVVNVTPSGGSTTTYNPDQYGCVYLQEPVGTYGVSLASPNGGPTFIDWQENLTPSQPSVSVSTVGLPAFVPTFHYDEAGTVSFSPSALAPMASNMPISVSNGGNLQPSGTAVVVAAGSNATTAALFPYATPYSVWYGDCTTVAGSTKEQPASPTTFALTPKGTTTAAITGLYTLAITATRAGGFTTAPNSAIATVNDPTAPGDGCPSTAKGSAPLVPGTYQPYGLAGFSGSGTTYSDQTAVLPQTYTVKIPYNATSASFSMQVTAAGIVYNGTTYPFGTNVPVTLP